MNLYCDNYATCGSEVEARDTPRATSLVARVRGWRVWSGTTFDGGHVDVILCPSCARVPRPLAPEPVLEGQEALFPPPGDPGTVEPE